jgi:hypothetical protein
MICTGNLEKIRIFYENYAAKLKNVNVFSFSYVSVGSVLFYEDFGMNSYSVDIDEAMKRWSDEARQRSVKRFIASIFKEH